MKKNGEGIGLSWTEPIADSMWSVKYKTVKDLNKDIEIVVDVMNDKVVSYNDY
jgi:hypothetical protein